MGTATVKKQSQENAIEPVIKYVRSDYGRGVPIPWRLKMALKVTLARLPVPYHIWSKLGIFRYGDVTREFPAYQRAFHDHLDFYKARVGSTPERTLELGPGDSIGHALSAKAAGVKGTYFIDAGDFATREESHYRAFYDYLKAEGATFKEEPEGFSRDAILAFANSQYKTGGLKEMASIPDGHIDLSHSHAVLEHIHRDDFQPYMHELFRVHKSGSISRHHVDLHDHLGGALNSFRFSEKFWEGAARGAGFYTNRLTMEKMVSAAENAGFKVEIHKIIKWETLPTPKEAMDESFQDKTEDELNVCTFTIVMEKP